jgi:hypothetical protein
VDDLVQDPPLGRILADSPKHFVGQGMVVAKIDDGVIDEDTIGPTRTRMPVFAKLDNDFNEFNDFLAGGSAPAGDNFQWHSLVHGTSFRLDGPKAMCFINETV